LKGIILAGGSGTRLFPITSCISKQLLPIYDKPMIYYPLSTLMLAGLTDILIISSRDQLPNFKRLFADGSEIGLKISYKIQERPEGLAQAFILAEDFLEGDSACLILGDNIFFGHDISGILETGIENVLKKDTAVIFTYGVSDPCRYGVAEIGGSDKVISIEEKPVNPKSNLAVVGLYFYPADVVSKAKGVEKSDRGELEITSLNQLYMHESRLEAIKLGRGHAWFDAGTRDSLLEASNFIQTIEKRQGLKVACLEEIAYNKNLIDVSQLKAIANKIGSSSYGKYLISLCQGE